MKIHNFNSVEKNVDSISAFSQLQWIDCSRSETLPLGPLEASLHAQHLGDIKNSLHPPLYEQTDDYEIVILRTIDERYAFNEPKTRAIAFILCENTVISIHDEDDTTLSSLSEKWSKRKNKRVIDVLSLIHFVFDEIANVYLNLREPLNTMASEWQRKLLDPNDPFNDWHVIMQAQSSLRGLNTTLELQKDALSTWQENTRYEFTASHIIKFNDLNGHFARIGRLSDGLKTDLDSLTQIYFASTGQRTSTNVQLLAVISAIFLPLNLIAGIFGMNFEAIPFLKNPFAPYVIVSLMVTVSGLLLWWFKKKNWY